jgi:acetoin utilization protein AcuB
VGIITQSDIFRAFMDITGIRLGGVQFALRVSDTPGSIKECVDILRARKARLVSLYTSYLSVTAGYRDVYIRVKGLSPEEIQAVKQEMAAHYEIIYVIQEKEGA